MLQLNRRNMLATTAIVTLFAASQTGAKIALRQVALGKVAHKHARRKDGLMPTTITLNNLDGSNGYTAPNVSYGHAFADGDIPHEGSVAVTDSNGNPVVVQMDAISRWPSGCPRFVVISHNCAETFAPGSSVTYTISASSNKRDHKPASDWGSSPNATMIANTNFTVEYSGFDAGSNTYTVSFNTILSTFSKFPWGTNYPLGGWEHVKKGPVCIEWHAWQYLINDSTGNPQGYVRCDMWVKAWSPNGPFEVDVRTSQPNMWNAISTNSERYNVSPGRWATLCVVKNGSTIVQNAGGTGDYRTTTIPNADFDTSTYRLTAAAGSVFPQQAIVFASTGTLPGGISASTIYWLGYVNSGTANPYICAQRSFTSHVEQNGTPAAWLPDTNYALNQVCINNNIIYVCVEAGVSGLSGGPTGTGDTIGDGTCEWENMTIPFTDQGTGTITAYPVNACFPSTGWNTGDSCGNPLWDGPGNRPPIFPGHNFSYLTTSSTFIPCYNANAGCETTNQSASIYAPNQNYGGVEWNQSETGDNAGDQRIGYVSNWGVVSVYNPADPFYLYASLQSALCFQNYLYSFMIDERGGLPFCGNNGPDKNGTPYTNLPAVDPNWAGDNTPGEKPQFGVGNWLPWSTEYQDESGYASLGSAGQYYATVPGSHMPAAWQIAYLKTGRPCFLEQGIHMGNTQCFMGYLTQQVLGGVTYYCVINGNYYSIQCRGWAWALRSLCQALYVTPHANAFQPVLRDYYNDNAAFQALYYTSYVPSEAATLGFLNVLDHGVSPSTVGHMTPFEYCLISIVVSMEVWRSGLTGSVAGNNWQILLDYMNAWWAIPGGDLPGSMYYVSLYDLVYSPNPGGLSTAYQTAIYALDATYNINEGYDNNNGMDPPYPSGGLYDQNNSSGGNVLVANFPENCNWYGSMARAAMKMVTVAEPTNTTVASLLSDLISYTAEATGISSTSAGIQWCGPQSGIIENYQTFAIF